VQGAQHNSRTANNNTKGSEKPETPQPATQTEKNSSKT